MKEQKVNAWVEYIENAHRLIIFVSFLLSACNCNSPLNAPEPGAPAPPSTVVAVSGIRSANVRWAESSDAGASPLTMYKVTASPPAGAPLNVSPPATEVSVPDLLNGTTYVFSVVATNATGDSEPATSNAITTPDVPAAPTSVSATEGDLAAFVRWTAPADTGGLPLIAFALVQSADGGVILVDANATQATVGRLGRTPCSFTVKAINAAGEGPPSAPSNEVTPYTKPLAPDDVIAIAGPSKVTLSWRAADTGGLPISSYRLAQSTDGGVLVVSGTATGAVLTGLARAAHRFTVTAVTAAGESPPSWPSNEVTPFVVPSAPEGVTATPGNAEATVTWRAPSDNGGDGITGFLVTASSDAGSTTVGGAQNQTSLSGLRNGTAYTFTVAAINAAGTGASSSPSAPVTPFTVPQAPANVVATLNGGLVVVDWTAPFDNGRPIIAHTVRGSGDAGAWVITDGGVVAAISGLRTSMTYTFTVTATNVAGEGPPSAPSNAVTLLGPPLAPVGVVARPGNQNAIVTWLAPLSTGGLPIVEYEVATTEGTFSVSAGGSAGQVTVNGLTNGTRYTFRVRARNALGFGPWSLPSNAVTPVLPCTGTLAFEVAPAFVDYWPLDVVVGDFNGDGRLDIASALDRNAVTVVLRTPAGAYTAPASYAVNGRPWSMSTGDFNGDGRLDLATAHKDGNTVSVLLGNGDGTFMSAVHYTVGTQPRSVTSGDFNGDGRDDLAVANTGSGNVSVLLANANGTFQAAVNHSETSSPLSIAIADLNADGKKDLTVANEGSISVRFGNGDGTFQAVSNYAWGAASTEVDLAAIDLDGDGKVDVAVANGGSVDVLLGAGNGTLQAATSYPVAAEARSIAAGDFNGDGRRDVAAVGRSPPHVTAFTTAANGTLSSRRSYSVGGFNYLEAGPWAVAGGDADGDGELDLVIADYGYGRADFMMGLGDGAFTGGRYRLLTGTGAESILSADLDGDARSDIVVGGWGPSVLLGAGTGAFSTPALYSGGLRAGLATGDFNADGQVDLAVTYDGVNVLLGSGNGAFPSAITFSSGGWGPQGLVAADFTGDGRLDLAVANVEGNISVLIGSSSGLFLPAVSTPTGEYPIAVIAGDFDVDGRLDVAVGHDGAGSANVWVLLGNGDGTFRQGFKSPTVQGVHTMTLGDLDSDGRLDLATASYGGYAGTSRNIGVLLGNGDGTFRVGSSPNGVFTPSAVVAADFNGDGRLDLSLTDYYADAVAILLAAGDGGFTKIEAATGVRPYAIAEGDFNGDGRLDLTVANYGRDFGSDDVSVLLSVCLP